MKANKAFKFRIYPDREQATLINKTFGCTRFVYNALLVEANTHYEKEGKHKLLGYAHLKEDRPWLKEVDSLSLANVHQDLKKGFQNYFKNPEHFGIPQFKKKNKAKRSYTTNVVNGNIVLFDNGIKLPKLGKVKGKMHRSIPSGYVLKSITVSQTKSGKYFASLLFEYENQVVECKDKNKSIGLDFSMPYFYVDSNGYQCDKPLFYYAIEPQIKRWQRIASKRYKKGQKEQSKSYWRARNKVARLYEKAANQRRDYIEKLSHDLVMKYDYIFIEDLDMQGLSQALNYGKKVGDNGWGFFVNRLIQKANEHGKHVIKIDKWSPSTQTCHVCGYINKETKDIKIKDWTCPVCGVHHDRDTNAAINILNFRLQLVA